MVDLATFSEWVRTTRRAKNLTLTDVAERAGVKQPVWSQWESGRAYPRRETVLKIADALQVSRRDALVRAGYLPMDEDEEETETMKRLIREIEPILKRVPTDKMHVAERALVHQAREISELLQPCYAGAGTNLWE